MVAAAPGDSPGSVVWNERLAVNMSGNSVAVKIRVLGMSIVMKCAAHAYLSCHYTLSHKPLVTSMVAEKVLANVHC